MRHDDGHYAITLLLPADVMPPLRRHCHAVFAIIDAAAAR